MKTLTLTSTISEQHVIAACQAAAKAERDYATKAVVAGILLLEYRDHLRTAHCEPGRSNAVLKHNQHTLPEHNFTLWVETQGIPISTAKRWMNAAERVARLQMGLTLAADFRPSIDVEGVVVPLSAALTAPEAELPDQALSFRQGFFDFLEDKTLAEATRAAVDGESPAHRITRAGAGKTKGGHAGEDRKDWPTFIAEKLSDVSSHLKHFRKFSGPQKDLAYEHLHRAVEQWPTPVLEHLAKCIKLEMAKR
jgi:hypothetical protein